MKKGIDVSEHQGVIDWGKVKPQIDFAMIRAGYGKGNIDKYFVRNISECNRLGIPCGAYWFSYAYTTEMAAAEAAACIEAIKPYKIDFPVVFDYEYDSTNYAIKKQINITIDIASAMVTAFCCAIEKAGYYAMFYANPDYLKRYFSKAIPGRFDLWLASWPKYPDINNPPQKCGMWQYGGQSYDGINSTLVDSNVSYKDDYRIATLPSVPQDEDKTKYVLSFGKADATAVQRLLSEKGISADIKEAST